MLQQTQTPPHIYRIAGNRHLGPIGQFGQRRVLQRIQAQIGQNAGLHADQFKPLVTHGIGQVIAVLVVIQVNITGIQGHIGRGPIRELDHLNIQPLLFRFLGRHPH